MTININNTSLYVTIIGFNVYMRKKNLGMRVANCGVDHLRAQMNMYVLTVE